MGISFSMCKDLNIWMALLILHLTPRDSICGKKGINTLFFEQLSNIFVRNVFVMTYITHICKTRFLWFENLSWSFSEFFPSWRKSSSNGKFFFVSSTIHINWNSGNSLATRFTKNWIQKTKNVFYYRAQFNSSYKSALYGGVWFLSWMSI